MIWTWQHILLLVIVLAANGVEAITGFGGTIVAVTLGAQLFDINFLVTSLAPIHILLSAYITARYYKDIVHEELWKRIIPIAGLGLPAGFFIARAVKGETLALIYGVFVFCIAIFELLRMYINRKATEPEAPLTLAKGAPWLFAGGIIQGIFLSGGPLIVYYANRALPDKAKFRSTLSAMWLILNICVFTSMIATHRTTVATMKESAILFPTLIVGIAIGDFLHKRISEKKFRIFVFVLLIIAGASLAIKSMQAVL